MNYLKSWVDLNTQMRILASINNDPAGKEFVKLLLNSLYGKSVERLEDRSNFTFVWRSEDTFKINKSVFGEGYKIINKSLALFKSRKKSVLLDRPLFIGVSILKLSKLQMFTYYYDFLKPTYGENISLLYSDTDSLVVKIIGDDNLDAIQHTLKNNSELFFFSKMKLIKTLTLLDLLR